MWSTSETVLGLSPRPLAAALGRVEVIDSHSRFAGLASEWNALVERVDDQVFYRHEFLGTWLEHFAGHRLRILTLREDCGRLSAALPLVHGWSRLHGLPVRQLRAAANSHSGRFDLLAEAPAQASTAFVEYLARLKDWDVLLLTELPRDGHARFLEGAASSHGLRTGRWKATRSPVIELPQSWEALEHRLSSRFLSNLRRRSRALARCGEVTVERISDDSGLVEEGMQLELRGWKGRAGTAMAQDPATRNFYTRLAGSQLGFGHLALWAMRVDGRLVAFQYGLEYRGCYALLKPAYDEDFSRFSPGQLLMARVLQDSIQRGLQRFDFLGDIMPWKQDWKPTCQAHDWLFVFRRSSYGRLMHALKFQLVPRARHIAKRNAP